MKSECAQGLATILDSTGMPSMHLLRCIGIVDQEKVKEKVLVYELPLPLAVLSPQLNHFPHLF